MDIIEFLERTNYKNLKYNVNFMFKQYLEEREFQLKERRKQLKWILDCENEQYERELYFLKVEEELENNRKRLEFIGIHRMQRQMDEAKLCESKKQQRDLENSEEVRHMNSKEILLDTKQAQLYQIEEKKAMKRRDKNIEKLWHKTMENFNLEREKQNNIEQKLQKTIAHSTQERNELSDKEMKNKLSNEKFTWNSHHTDENLRAINIDRQYREAAQMYNNYKKMKNAFNLKDQINANEVQKNLEKNKELAEVFQNNQEEAIQTERHLQENLHKKFANREWHQHYLEHAMNEKKQLKARDDQLELMTLGGGCVLHQKKKIPYGKSVR